MVPTSEIRSLDPKSKIKILNPVATGGEPKLVMISVKHASRYVRQGRADFVQNGNLLGLRFRDQAAHARRLEDLTAPGYDRAGRRTVEEIRRLPVVGNVVIGLTLTTKRSKARRERTLFRLAGERAMVRNRPVLARGEWCHLELPA